MSVNFRQTSIATLNEETDKNSQLLATINAAPLPEVTDGTDLSQVQAYRKALINQQYGQKIDGGFYSYAEKKQDSSENYEMLLYKSDRNHREQLGLLNDLAAYHKQGEFTAVKCTWKDASEEDEPCHEVTDDCVIQLFAEMGQHLLWCKLTADELVKEITAATTVDSVNAITFPDESVPTIPVYPVTFSVTAGTYSAAQSVTLSCKTSSATIYYTLDGSAPTASSNKYADAVSISASETIKAVAISGNQSSDISSAAYIISAS
jgi:hypothetical protein